jgi:hypothetical protein
MRRLFLLAPLLALVAGCIVRAGPPVYASPPPEPPPPPVYAPPPPPPPQPQPVLVWYGGQHYVPESMGGGWCYVEGPHQHPYYPDQYDRYVVQNNVYYWSAPLAITFYAGHPLPGGGWCYIAGPHLHDYYPPHESTWAWRRGYGYVYSGPYSHERPPPPHYWPRAAPRPIAPPDARPAPPRPSAPAPHQTPAPRPAPQPIPSPP